MSEKEFHITEGNIFKDLDLSDSEELTVHSELLSEINQIIRNSKLTQKEIARLLNISPPKVSMLMNGKLSVFSTDSLMKYLRLLGRSIEIRVTGQTPLTPRIRHGHISVRKNRHSSKMRKTTKKVS